MARNYAATRESEISTNKCLEVLQRGRLEDLYKILPQIGVLRSESFFQPLIKLLDDHDRNKQQFAAQALGALGDVKALKYLSALLNDPKTHKGKNPQSLQSAIIDAIGQISSDESVEILVKLLDLKFPGDTLSRYRKALIIEALGSIAQQEQGRALQTLIDLLDDQDAETRMSIIPEISVAFWHRPNQIPEEVFLKLRELTKDLNPSVRYTALMELKTLADLGCNKAKELQIPDKILD